MNKEEVDGSFAIPTQAINSSQHDIVCIQKDALSETRVDNPVISHIDGDDTRKADSLLEILRTPKIESTTLGKTIKRSADSFSNLHVDSLYW